MKLENNSLSIGSILGIPLRLHVSLLIAIGVLTIFSGANFITIVILALGIFGSIALHELGHSVVARAKGGYIHEIVLYPFGGAAKISNIPKRPIDEMMVALAGPAVSLILALIFQTWEVTLPLSWVNFMLFFFNILPVFPMDGGRVLRAALTIKHGRLVATRMAATVGKYFCGLFVLIGLFGLPVRVLDLIGPFDKNYMLAFIGGYIYFAGQTEYRMVMQEYRANSFDRPHTEGQVDVEVSPPPYASSGNESESTLKKLRNLFRR